MSEKRHCQGCGTLRLGTLLVDTANKIKWFTCDNALHHTAYINVKVIQRGVHWFKEVVFGRTQNSNRRPWKLRKPVRRGHLFEVNTENVIDREWASVLKRRLDRTERRQELIRLGVIPC